jgi:hypothetical protein
MGHTGEGRESVYPPHNVTPEQWPHRSWNMYVEGIWVARTFRMPLSLPDRGINTKVRLVFAEHWAILGRQAVQPTNETQIWIYGAL